MFCSWSTSGLVHGRSQDVVRSDPCLSVIQRRRGDERLSGLHSPRAWPGFQSSRWKRMRQVSSSRTRYPVPGSSVLWFLLESTFSAAIVILPLPQRPARLLTLTAAPSEVTWPPGRHHHLIPEPDCCCCWNLLPPAFLEPKPLVTESLPICTGTHVGLSSTGQPLNI